VSGRFKPSRSLRGELFSLALALLVPLLLFAVFPLSSLWPLPVPPKASATTSFAFISLTPKEEKQALAAARASWQLDRSAIRQMRIDLFADSLPAIPPRPVIDLGARARTDRGALAPYAPDPLPPTLAAPPPATIAPQPDANAVVPAFSREELLELD